jgi:hypothetical protein
MSKAKLLIAMAVVVCFAAAAFVLVTAMTTMEPTRVQSVPGLLTEENAHINTYP